MKKHIGEIDNISDENHVISFYNQDTLLGGIKTLCYLEDSILEEMTALDILKLLNIVGIPCVSPIGDFPDPSKYFVNKLLIGSFVSLSDILVVKEMGNMLKNPYGEKEEIVNVIPYYDDENIHSFLVKYAPTLLEYTASLGMRNLISDIPHSYKYTLTACLKNIILNNSINSENNKSLVKNMINNYSIACNTYFDSILNDMNINDNKAIYIGDNGMTNLIKPIIDIYSIKHKDKIRFMPNILRSIYLYEYQHFFKKMFRGDSEGITKKSQILNNILSIDFDKWRTPLPNYFEENKNPKFYKRIIYNMTELNKIIKQMEWLDNIILIPNIINNNKVNLTSNLIKIKLRIENIHLFKCCCIYYAIEYDKKSDRMDEDLKTMKLPDPIHSDMLQLISQYIECQYKSEYQSRLDKRRKEEFKMLIDELIEKLIKTSDIQEFTNLLKSGIQKGCVSAKIKDMNGLGYLDLQNKLFNKNISVPIRDEKLYIFILGCDYLNNPIWNNNNVIRLTLIDITQKMNVLNLIEFWNKNILNKFKEKSIHQYRSIMNRHTHDNKNPSYWAYGFKNLGEYFKNISKNEKKQYIKNHQNCCGIWDGKVMRLA